METDSRFCYTCLETDVRRVFDLHANDLDEISYFDKLTVLINTELVTQDIMQICYNCVKELRRSVTFKHTVLLSQQALRSKLDVKNYVIDDQLEEFLKIKDKHRLVNDSPIESDDIKNEVQIIIDESNINSQDENSIEVVSNEDQRLIELDLSEIYDKEKCGVHQKSENRPKCYICNKSFLSISDLGEHMETHTEREPALQFKCIKCNLTYDKKSDLVRHFEVKYCERKHVCDICNKRFTHKSNLTDHMTTHLGEKNFNCTDCGKKFATSFSLKRHKKRFHPDSKEPGNEIESVEDESLLDLDAPDILYENQSETLYKCNECQFVHKDENILIKHVGTHKVQTDQKQKTKFKCIKCNLSFDKESELTKHFETNYCERKHVCVVCNKRFKKVGYLHEHMIIHTEEAFKCTDCGKLFATEIARKYHREQIHYNETKPDSEFLVLIKNESDNNYYPIQTENSKGERNQKRGNKLLICYSCKETFSTKLQLRRHINSIHIQKKKHICLYCSLTFKRPLHLREHMASHTGEMYSCKICNKKFQKSSSIKRHEKTHNSVPGQKTKRTPFLCNVCGKSFPFSNSFQRHMAVHTGVKKHKCHICDRSFNQSTHLHVHMRTHTGEKPYNCKICGEMFSLNASLRKHLNTHNK